MHFKAWFVTRFNKRQQERVKMTNELTIGMMVRYSMDMDDNLTTNKNHSISMNNNPKSDITASMNRNMNNIINNLDRTDMNNSLNMGNNTDNNTNMNNNIHMDNNTNMSYLGKRQTIEEDKYYANKRITDKMLKKEKTHRSNSKCFRMSKRQRNQQREKDRIIEEN